VCSIPGRRHDRRRTRAPEASASRRDPVCAQLRESGAAARAHEDIERLREPALPICVRSGRRASTAIREVSRDSADARARRLWDATASARGEGGARAPPTHRRGACRARRRFQLRARARPRLRLLRGHRDRALHFDPNASARLAPASCRVSRPCMAAVGKHFPGHGFAPLDSHVEVPRDDRPLKDIFQRMFFLTGRRSRQASPRSCPPHVIYTQWTRASATPGTGCTKLLRSRLGFECLVSATTCRCRREHCGRIG